MKLKLSSGDMSIGAPWDVSAPSELDVKAQLILSL